MSFYENDNESYLNQCLESLYYQTLPANQIVLIQDGQVGSKLSEIVEKWAKYLPIEVFKNDENLGLGKSLNLGVNLCKYEIIARMDADDICYPNRFEKQYNYLKENIHISAVSSWVAEFESDVSNIIIFKKLPSDPEVLYNYSKSRSPLNHPAVMFRKSAVLAAGNYDPYKNQQDYQLWVRMLLKGYKISNLPEPLLYMRIGNDLYQRRGGISYLRIEYAVQKDFYKLGFISFPRLFINLFIRGIIRVFPNNLRKLFYKKVLRKNE
jgi:glycosyltransferase involved in cell wall biosynthesis